MYVWRRHHMLKTFLNAYIHSTYIYSTYIVHTYLHTYILQHLSIDTMGQWHQIRPVALYVDVDMHNIKARWNGSKVGWDQ